MDNRLEDNLRKVPPQNLEAECSILGAVMLDNAALNRVLEINHPDHFYRESHCKIFNAMLDLDELGEPIDLVTLSDRLKSKDELEEVGGTAYLASLHDFTPTAANVKYYAQIVRDKAIARALIRLGTDVTTRGYEDQDPIFELIQRANSELSKIIEAAKDRSRADRIPLLACIADVQRESVSWVWDNRIALGKLMEMVGDGGVGKSFTSQAIAAAISRGFGLPGQQRTEPANAILINAEDGLSDTLRPRLEDMGADLSRIFSLTGLKDKEGRERSLSLEDLDVIENATTAHSAKLLVIDPVIAFTAAKDTHKASDVRSLLAPLAAIAGKQRCAIITIRHLTKSAAKVEYRGQGSADFFNASRLAFLCGEDPEDRTRKIFCQIKSNLGPKMPSLSYSIEDGRFLWGEESSLTADQILAVPADTNERSKLDEAKEFLTDLLADEPLESTKVLKEARQAGIAEKTLYRAKDALGVKPKKNGFGGGWVWDLSARRWPRTPEDGLDGQAGNLGDLGPDLTIFGGNGRP
jgi:DNA repair protein RadA/Sms